MVNLRIAVEIPIARDVSQDLSVAHRDEIESTFSKHKRDMSRAQNICPAGRTFLWSRCFRARGAQAYGIVCQSQDPEPIRSLFAGSCEANEICTDGRPDYRFQEQGHADQTAWCVSHLNFVRVVMGMGAGKDSATLTTEFHPSHASDYTVEAILTDLDGRVLVDAEDMAIRAQASKTIGNVESWGTLVGGDDRCTNCSTVELFTVPNGTKRIKVRVELQPGVERALLYLATLFNPS